MVYSSAVGFDNLSIAYCESHELVSVLDARVAVEWILNSFSFIQPRIWGTSLISELMFFDFSKIIKFIHRRLSDRNHLFYNIPKDSFGAWNSGQGALVSPSSVEF